MFLDDLATRLEDEGVATLGTDLFLSTRAAPPFLASGSLTVVETGGSGPDLFHNKTDGAMTNRPSAQITARAASYQVARALAQNAYDALFITNTFINSGFYLWIRPLQEPFDGGTDDRGHIRVQFNVTANKRP